MWFVAGGWILIANAPLSEGRWIMYGRTMYLLRLLNLGEGGGGGKIINL